jgi:hypothetical protein
MDNLIDLSTLDLNNIDPAAMISRHFTFREALYLPSWGRLGGVQDGLTLEVLARIGYFLRNTMDVIRDRLGPVVVHVCWRPLAYNQLVAGHADHSMHMAEVDHLGNPLKPDDLFAAMDFNIQGFAGGTGCDQTRAQLVPMIPELKIRVENLPGSDWVHVDNGPVIHNAYFSV